MGNEWELLVEGGTTVIRPETTQLRTMLDTLITACQKFSAAHGVSDDAECMDAVVGPEDWHDFDAAVIDVVSGRGDEWRRVAGGLPEKSGLYVVSVESDTGRTYTRRATWFSSIGEWRNEDSKMSGVYAYRPLPSPALLRDDDTTFE